MTEQRLVDTYMDTETDALAQRNYVKLCLFGAFCTRVLSHLSWQVLRCTPGTRLLWGSWPRRRPQSGLTERESRIPETARRGRFLSA